ncbi:hypothetical protein F5Y10DRAFT_266153 [Nemania abortiva]|nr:hypothetical protein F5Y10DRAFT_266153 [Nemania abortiva]
MLELTDYQKIDEPLLKSLSQLLIDCGVTPVLWGDYLLTIYGVPSVVGGLEFIVPDEKLPAATAALKRTKLSPCQDTRICPVSREAAMPHIPTFHMHFGTSQPAFYVSLWPHSQILSFAPEANILSEDLVPGARVLGPYVLASDTSVLPGPRAGRGHGALSKGGRVIVPSAHTLLEAYIRLSAAHLNQPRGPFYLGMITYVDMYIDADGLLDETLLPEPCRVFWRDWKKDELSMWQLCDQFKATLEAERFDDQDEPGTLLCI